MNITAAALLGRLELQLGTLEACINRERLGLFLQGKQVACDRNALVFV
jgi:hypothetical protein